MTNLTILVVLLSFPVFARNHIAYMGGGGEPQGSNTIFDGDVNRFGDFVDRMPEDTNLSVTFNGGHSLTEGRLARKFPRTPNTPFTPAAFETLVTRYENDIREGRITSSDQLMLFIDTHGGENMAPQATHNVATSYGAIANFDQIAGARTVNLDRLQALTTLAESRGIRMAVVDVSCHSGASLPLANSTTCVISATGPRHYGFAGAGTFSSHFIRKMRPGRNLDQIFHDVRDNTSDTDFPMISSPVGRDIQNEIYPLLTRFLYDYERMGASKLSNDIIKSITTNSCEQENQSLATLINLLNDVERVTNEDFRRLRDLVSEYQALRTNLQTQIKGMLNNPALSESRQVCHNSNCFPYTGREVIAMDIDATIAVARRAGTQTPSSAAFYQNWENTLNQLKPWKAQLLANPAVGGFPNFFHNYPSLERQTEGLARRISREERRLYREMAQSRAADPRPNPCRDFRL